MFGLEKLGLLHFDARKCYVHSAKFLRCQIVSFNPWFKLSAVLNCPFIPIVSNCLRSQIARGVKWSAVSNCPVSNCPRCQICPQCQIVLESPSKYCSFLVFLSLERKQLKI